jgi:hypothetical protein
MLRCVNLEVALLRFIHTLDEVENVVLYFIAHAFFFVGKLHAFLFPFSLIDCLAISIDSRIHLSPFFSPKYVCND